MTDDHDARMLAHLLQALEPHGIGADRLILTYEDYLQDYDLQILGGDLTDAQIEALFDATRLGGCVRFAEPANETRWGAHLKREGAALLKTRAAEVRGQNPDLPRFNRSTDTLPAFARSLELWAGLEPGSALVVTGEKTVQLDFAERAPDLARFHRLMQAMGVLAEEDIEVVMIGRSTA
ncbi:hypothetical protein [Brevundimonas sp. FT23042]|uniref:hypothetical protein n=1 Tax=Brevundimonas sp. FT23042 TaxID=3393749 RepID=UPI003B58932D